jgi:hypothetical protein
MLVRLKMKYVREWENVHILIIDKISFFCGKDMDKLDKKLKRLKGNQELFGGVSIIFLGDFHQLQPVGANKN